MLELEQVNFILLPGGHGSPKVSLIDNPMASTYENVMVPSNLSANVHSLIGGLFESLSVLIMFTFIGPV
jgi:hypothetical protein